SLKTEDEFGHLTEKFNQMTHQLSHYHKANLEHLNSEICKSQAILASIEDGIIIFDTQLSVTEINPVAQRMLFLTTTKTTFKCSDILKGTPICDLLSQIIESGEPPNLPDKQRMVAISKDEQLHHYLFSINVINGKENKTEKKEKLSGIVLLLRDVTRLKEVERLKNEFILAASHELRTPLTSLSMNIDLLRDQAKEHLDEEEKGFLQTAHEEVHRMKALVTDLLDLSKIESGRIALEFESVPVKTLFEYVLKVFKTQLERKTVTLAGTLTDDLPNIRADANKITWVLSNLISNALRYVNDGGHIQFVAKRIGPQIHLSVHDDGPGIPLEYQSKIFQKYVQVKGQESGGTGLGLAICKEIVRAHGGGIWVESLPGQGSTFTFTLPVSH
ncbi:MAG: ATP-binding protein, partial [Desulfobacteraceae bacterium]